MVGRKTSGRCANCRRKKIKCDLSRPACGQCLKSDLRCPGYQSQREWQVYTVRKVSSRVSGGDAAEPSSLSSSVLVRASRHRSASIPTSPLSADDLLRNEFIFKMRLGALPARLLVYPVDPILQKIPIWIGRDYALDAAVRCMCTTSQSSSGLIPSGEEVRSASNYLSALNALQQTLSDGSGDIQAEVIAAATLLQMRDAAVGSESSAWFSHANGVIKMLRHRGPSKSTSELEKAILRAQMGNIFISAMLDRTPCFLAEDGWHELLVSDDDGNDTSHMSAFSAMLQFAVFMPGLLCSYEDSNSQMSKPSDLLHEIKRVYEYTFEWRKENSKIREKSNLVASPDDDEHVALANVGGQHVERVLHASSLAYHMFLLCLEYMFEEVSAPQLNEFRITTQSSALDLLEEDIPAGSVQRFLHLGQGIKVEVSAIRAIDPLIADSTVSLMHLLLGRVLQVSSGHQHYTKIQVLRGVLYDVLNCLQNSLGPLVDYGRDDNLDPTQAVNNASTP